MLRTLIISPDTDMGTRLSQALAEIGHGIQVCKIVEQYQAAGDLARTLRTHAPEVIFVSFEDISKAMETIRHLESHSSGLQIIAVNRVCDATLLRETMRLGVREFLSYPFDLHSVVESLRSVKGLLDKKPPVYELTNQVFSFLPSKAGTGTTTLALNVSAALARVKDNAVLLTDLDLNSGMLRFLLKLDTEYSLLDAVENAAQMDEAIWPQLVTAKYGMDVLHAGHVNPNLRIEPVQIQNLVQFARRNYKTLVFDLSGNLERYSLEAMQESRRIFLVCTPEIPSLHLAREKMGFLKTLGLDTRVSLLLNRVGKKAVFTNAQVEELVGAQLVYSFSNDYLAVSRATTSGQCLAPESVIGKQCTEFIDQLNERRPATTERKKKFLEFFSVGTPQPASAD